MWHSCMSTPQSWSRGSRRQVDEVGWTWKVTEMGQGTDKGRKRQEREEGRSYHDSPYIPDEIAECLQPPQPSPVMVDDQEEYEVKEILDSRFRWGKLWYLVKFVGWSVMIRDTRSGNRSCDRSGDFSPTFSMFVYVC